MSEQQQTPETVGMSEAEELLWDELWDTDAARCCSCPSCNYYAPDYEQHKDEPCLLQTLVERIIAARSEGLRSEWGHRYPSGGIVADSSETVARSRAVISQASAGEPLVLMRRAVTEWEEVDV